MRDIHQQSVNYMERGEHFLVSCLYDTTIVTKLNLNLVQIDNHQIEQIDDEN